MTGWLIDQIDSKNRWIVDQKGSPIGGYQEIHLAARCLFPTPEVNLNTNWIRMVYSHLAPTAILKEWWMDGKAFRTRATQVYETSCLNKPYRIAVFFFSRLYGEPDGTSRRDYWMPVISEIVLRGSIFNWAAILSSNIEKAVQYFK